MFVETCATAVLDHCFHERIRDARHQQIEGHLGRTDHTIELRSHDRIARPIRWHQNAPRLCQDIPFAGGMARLGTHQ